MIYLQTLDRNWNPGKKSINFDNKDDAHDFHLFIASEYVRLVKISIDKQRFKSKWKRLSSNYFNYKKRSGLSTKIWIATGELKDNLKVLNKRKSVITVGFDNRKKHKNSKVKLSKLACYLEFGTLNIPPRPLFKLVYQYMRKHIKEFYIKYLRLNKKKLLK